MDTGLYLDLVYWPIKCLCCWYKVLCECKSQWCWYSPSNFLAPRPLSTFQNQDHVSRWSHWKIGDCEQSTLSPPLGLQWYARLLPNGHLGARVTYDLPSDDQNFKQGAWTGAWHLWFSYLIPVNRQQNSLLILHFETTMENIWSLAIGKKIVLPIKGKHTALFLWLALCQMNFLIVSDKNFDNKIMTFPSVLAGFKLHVTSLISVCC